MLKRVDHAERAAPSAQERRIHQNHIILTLHSQVDQYPLPKPSDLMTCLTGGRRFTKRDLTAAYQQMLLDEESARLPGGVASALAVFQRAMDSILQGMPYVTCYHDVILVTGRTDEEHLQGLEEVLRRLRDHGTQLKKEFLQSSVEYLGHLIDEFTLPRRRYLPFWKLRLLRTFRNYVGLITVLCKVFAQSCFHPASPTRVAV